MSPVGAGLTLTVNTHLSSSPHASFATYTISVVPTGNSLPDAGPDTRSTVKPSKLQVVVAVGSS